LVNRLGPLEYDLRDLQLKRLRRAIAMATTSELHRASDLLEFALEVRRGKRQQRAGWRGRSQRGSETPPRTLECVKT